MGLLRERARDDAPDAWAGVRASIEGAAAARNAAIEEEQDRREAERKRDEAERMRDESEYAVFIEEHLRKMK